MLKLDSGIDCGESAVDGCLGLVALGLQSNNLSFKGIFIADAASQTLSAENAELYLRHPFGRLRTGLSQLPCLGV